MFTSNFCFFGDKVLHSRFYLHFSRVNPLPVKRKTICGTKTLPDETDTQNALNNLNAKLDRLITAIEELRDTGPKPNIDLDAAEAFIWHPENLSLAPVKKVNRVAMPLLKGIDQVRDILIENTERFAAGKPANNVLALGRAGHGQIIAGQSIPGYRQQ